MNNTGKITNKVVLFSGDCPSRGRCKRAQIQAMKIKQVLENKPYSSKKEARCSVYTAS